MPASIPLTSTNWKRNTFRNVACTQDGENCVQVNPSVVATTSPHTNCRNVRKELIGRTVQPFIIANVHGPNHKPGNYARPIRSEGHQKGANADAVCNSVGTSLSRNEHAYYHYDPKCPSHHQHVARVQVLNHTMKAPGLEMPTRFHAVDLFKTNLSSIAHESRVANGRSFVSTSLQSTNNSNEILKAPTRSIAASSADFVRNPVVIDTRCINNHPLHPHVHEVGRPSPLRVNAKAFVSRNAQMPCRSKTLFRNDADVMKVAMQISSLAFLSAVSAAGAARAASAAVHDLAYVHNHWTSARAQLQASPVFLAHSSPVADSKKRGKGISRLVFESTTKSMLERSYALTAPERESNDTECPEKTSDYDCANQNLQLKIGGKKKSTAHKQYKLESKQIKRVNASNENFGPRAQPSPAEIEKAIAKACVLACTVECDIPAEK